MTVLQPDGLTKSRSKLPVDNLLELAARTDHLWGAPRQSPGGTKTAEHPSFQLQAGRGFNAYGCNVAAVPWHLRRIRADMTIVPFPHSKIVRSPELVARLKHCVVPYIHPAIYDRFADPDWARQQFSDLHAVVVDDVNAKWCVEYLHQITCHEVCRSATEFASAQASGWVTFTVVRNRLSSSFGLHWNRLVIQIANCEKPDVVLQLVLDLAKKRAWPPKSSLRMNSRNLVMYSVGNS